MKALEPLLFKIWFERVNIFHFFLQYDLISPHTLGIFLKEKMKSAIKRDIVYFSSSKFC